MFLIFIFPSLCFAQLQDNFDDGNFSLSQEWKGDVSQFEVNSSNQLHLKSTGTDISYLSTECSLSNAVEWKFWIKLSFATSANNNARFYLISNNSNLEEPLNGYFVQIGESNDSISLCRQNGSNIECLIKSKYAYTNNSTNPYWIKVTRDETGLWSLFSDNTTGLQYQIEGTASDTAKITSGYTGVYCKYTSSNATKFYFDDISIKPIVKDTVPPSIIDTKALSENKVKLTFSEPISFSQNDIYNIAKFTNDSIHISSVAIDTVDLQSMIISLSTPLRAGIEYKMAICLINDANGNTINQTTVSVRFYKAHIYDVIINEIMADPTPSNGLPEFEYVELYNRKPFDINISGWTFSVGSTNRTIESVLIPANGYVLLCDDDAKLQLSKYSNCQGFSSFTLTNTGSDIVLKDVTSQIISSVSYSDSWYDDNTKSEGGWSLELVNPNDPCIVENNWVASSASIGGTPGAVNSVVSLNKAVEEAKIIKVLPMDTTSIKLFFNKKIDTTVMLDNSIYTIEPLLNISTNIETSEDRTSVVIHSIENIKQGIIYTLKIEAQISDCIGNISNIECNAQFAASIEPNVGDIVINEVLFDPIADDPDFVELYNRTDRVISLSNLQICSIDEADSSLTDKVSLPQETQIFPHEIVALSVSPEAILKRYQVPSNATMIKMSDFPAYNNDMGSVVLINKKNIVIDMMHYVSDMHYNLLTSVDGVSLEKINPNLPSETSSNWHSASESNNFGTPGYQNSQFYELESTKGSISIEKELFTPDNNGVDDLLLIQYQLESEGFTGRIQIFDIEGRLIRDLVKNELLANKGVFTWDGSDNSHQQCSSGIYILYFEANDLKGNIIHQKIACILGEKM